MAALKAHLGLRDQFGIASRALREPSIAVAKNPALPG
jgi:hypothetical protein